MTDNIGGKLTRFFIDSKLTALVMIAITIIGVGALLLTPREENPQIDVPGAHIMVMFPGASPEEVEQLVCKPLERLVWDVRGVEEVHSVCMPGMGVVSARFFVGQDLEDSVFKIYDVVYSNLDDMPEGVMHPLVKPVDIDDVPIVAVTLYSNELDDYRLRRIGEKILGRLKRVEGTNYAEIRGGDARQINVKLKPDVLAQSGLTPLQVVGVLEGANVRYPADDIELGDQRMTVQVGRYLETKDDVASLVVAAPNGKPIYLRDIADITDGRGERTTYTRIGFGHGHEEGDKAAGTEYSAVTIAIAKKRGLNSVVIANRVLAEMQKAGDELPANVEYQITRNDGLKADTEVNELVKHLLTAIIIVVILLFLTLGWRDAAVVSIAIPLTLFVTLALGGLVGQTINRITLFALILSLGLLVDDAIVVVENTHRHLRMFSKKKNRAEVCIGAVNEIAYPTIYATIIVSVSMLTMAFVTGMMGPYMGPIPFNVPTAMMVSLFVAFAITPWLAKRMLKVHDSHEEEDPSKSPMYRRYGKLVRPLLQSGARRNLFYGVLVALFMVVMTFPMFQWVKFRMLPKQDANTFLVTLDMPDGTGLSHTDAVTRRVTDFLAEVPEIADYEVFVGTSSVIDFNGILRGSAFRSAPHFADVRINLMDKHHRDRSSEHIVYEVRDGLAIIGEETGANIKIVENPPGPPVRSTLVAEIYGEDPAVRASIARNVQGWYGETSEVVDIDTSLQEDHPERNYVVNREKATLAGLDSEQIVQALTLALRGHDAAVLHDSSEETQVAVNVRFPAERRNREDFLEQIKLPNTQGRMVPLAEVVDTVDTIAAKNLSRKNLKPVTYVFGEMGKRSSVYAMFDLFNKQKLDPLPDGYKIVWEGEWDLTLDVFRDLGLAMGAGIILIYLILVARFQSFSDPAIIMGAIPLTMIGVMPGFAILGNFDVYFSATGMIGVIALSGIVVRNALILIEFIQDRKAEGMELVEALIQAGATRARPIILTAVSTMAGMFTIALDPVWSGLAWSVLFGMIASTILTLVVIPVLYYTVNHKTWKKDISAMKENA